MRAVAVVALASALGAVLADSGICDSACIASRTPRFADMQGDLDVPQAFSAGGIVVSGIKGKEALTADALHVSKHLHTSLLDSDRVRSEVLSTNIIQSPTGELRLEGVASVSGSVNYVTPGASFLQVAEDTPVHPGRPWTQVSADSFDDGTGGAWAGATSHCGDANHFLGGHCVASHHAMTRVHRNLPPHRELRLRARFHFIDEWRGESAFAKVDGQVVWIDSHTSKATGGISMCGNPALADQRLGVPVDIIIPHDAPDAEVVLGATLDRDPCAVSWGADDVELLVR